MAVPTDRVPALRAARPDRESMTRQAINLRATEPARAIVARDDPAEHDKMVPYGGARRDSEPSLRTLP